MTIQHPQDVHRGIRCDECGACPIKGARYKSKFIFNFDICELCKNDKADCGEFVRGDYYCYEKHCPEANLLGPRYSNVINGITSVDAELQLVRKGKKTNMAYFFPFYHSDVNEETECRALVKYIDDHPFLTNVHILFPNNDRVLQFITEGLKHNKSVRFLDLQLSNRSHSFLSRAECFQHLIQGENVLETLVISTTQAYTSFPDHQNDEIFTGQLDSFAKDIFNSLQRTSLKTFRLDFRFPLSDERIRQAWETVQSNPSLRRFHVDTQDKHLEMLTFLNRIRAKQRWVDVSTTTRERINILLQLKEADFDHEVTWSIYHLFQSFPEAIRY